MQAFKLNKLCVATALALAFGPGARVVEAASLCYLPGASQMGMGCGGNTGTADSTLVPNVGAALASSTNQAPWGGGASAYQQAMQAMSNNQLPQIPLAYTSVLAPGSIPAGAQIVGSLPYTVIAAGGCSSYTNQVNLIAWNGQYYQQGVYGSGQGYEGGCGGG